MRKKFTPFNGAQNEYEQISVEDLKYFCVGVDKVSVA